MILNIVIILGFQLAGETLVRGLGLSLPGPVLGLAGLFVTFLLFPAVARMVSSTAQGLLAHLSMLFVPAGVGVVQHLSIMESEGLGLLLAVLASTTLALIVGAFTFVGVARLTEGPKEAKQ
ncbi:MULTISPECIES: CidA/LrgA family protein [Rhodobacterales]|uniref:CidA/LrgA family protein n=1 Tax=Rhodobacterales TaxID=204455 RepID=UPI001C97EA71|nr:MULTISPECIES: CidA/LrgA family protein [Rhodobacterales]MBY6090787.1 CidA/LrgA family protein [Maritimibacter alkaliphilus]MCA0920556.1 CidA/LrgA family protein [Pseudooceanicola nanhaiensis]